MIELIIEDTKHMLNGLELMLELNIQPDYGDVMLLNQMVNRAKRMVDRAVEINTVKENPE